MGTDMRIALIGYGKMGQTIEALGKKKGYEFPLIIDLNNPGDLNTEQVSKVDVAIEFTSPESAPGNLLRCFELGLPVVCGSTGWGERLEEIEAACSEQKGALFTASNFSIGVNILFALNRKLASLVKDFPEYRASMQEVHHVHKLDAPSGTALSLAEDLLEIHTEFKAWSLEEPQDDSILHIDAVREGEVKGRHLIRYESDLDSISLEHDAKSRDGFASGALMAASFLKDRRGIFGMQDMLKLDE